MGGACQSCRRRYGQECVGVLVTRAQEWPVQKDNVNVPLDVVTEVFGLTCPYVENITQSLATALEANIAGEPEALAILRRSTQLWNEKCVRHNYRCYLLMVHYHKHPGWRTFCDSVQSGTPSPLFLALTGTTGVGKTQTAHILAEAILKRRRRVPHTDLTEPDGLLYLQCVWPPPTQRGLARSKCTNYYLLYRLPHVQW